MTEDNRICRTGNVRSAAGQADLKPISASAMRRVEDKGTSLGISKIMMMENAANSIAHAVLDIAKPSAKRKRILLIAGTGNNGGDVFAAARHLAYYRGKFALDVIVVGDPAHIKSDEALTNFNIIKRIPSISINYIDSISKLHLLRRKLEQSQVAVVGVFGTGFHDEPRELQRRVIELINSVHRTKKISVDLPSGMEADSGRCDFAVRSDMTVTMHRPKKGMLANSIAKKVCGRLIIANIGLPF
ncbi:MAG TPA: NAD(P)H-hydrate epimerase [Nitrososphaerales archaeon]|nr:NAD(P)H-hydrate epimerase [Nitrososphaerales archaeon]